jgi:pentatricopeptide repeat protein
MFARSRHAFAPLLITGRPERSDGHSVPDGTIIPLARPIPVRRNSTSVPLIVPDGSRMLSSPPSPTGIPTLSILDPATPQSVSPPSVSSPLLPVKGVDEQPFSAAFIALRDSRDSKDYLQALREVQSFRATAVHLTVAEFNMALEALHETRVEGHPLDDILETYNDMISRSVYPNARTYMILILALTDRDHEVHMTIDSLATRGKWNARYGQSKFARKESEDEQKFANLRQENNFSSALSLFKATTALTGFRKIPLIVYSNLLRSAAYHANVDAALTIFAHLEKRHDILPSIAVFWNLVSVYANAGDISGAKEVFDEFRNAVRNRSIAWTDKTGHRSDGTEFAKEITPHGPQRAVWNKMIEAYVICGQPVNALGLLEQMMDAKSGGALDIAGPPPPTSSTYTHIISAFCRLGDIKTALGWFDRLLHKQDSAGQPSEAAAIPPRPDQLAWSVMIHHLAHEEMVDDLNRIFAILLDNAESENLDIRAADRVVVFATNMRALDASRMTDDRAIEILDFLSERVVPQNRFTNSDRVTIHFPVARQMILALAQKYIKFNRPDGAYRTLERYSRPVLDWCRQVEGEGTREQDTHSGVAALRKMICETSPEILDTLFRSQTATFDDVFQIARLSDRLGLSPHHPVAPYYLHAFARAATNGQSLALSFHDWELLLYAAAVMELPTTAHPKLPDYAFGGMPFLLEQLASFRIPLESLSIPILSKVSRVLRSQYEAKDLKALFETLGPAYEKTLSSLGRDLGPEETPAHKSGFAIRCDIGHSRYVDQHYPSNPNVTPLNAYARFEAGVRSGNYPVPATIGRLINSLGRLGEFDKVRRLYDAGQLVLSSFDQDKVLQSRGWFQIEDSMIIANAHGGNVEAAHVHRNRILQQGGAPTADAYGALIQAVKDTTDDCSNALALFHEAQLRGVTPSVYLFNTIISKLAKARKADFAIELFQQMKASGFSPSSITFGAVIAACARVGDAQSAEQLFDEMTRQPNFKPRIPPYNTMIQMYTTTKPSRERALYFYEQLQLLGIGPTAHTYKVRLDSWSAFAQP